MQLTHMSVGTDTMEITLLYSSEQTQWKLHYYTLQNRHNGNYTTILFRTDTMEITLLYSSEQTQWKLHYYTLQNRHNVMETTVCTLWNK